MAAAVLGLCYWKGRGKRSQQVNTNDALLGTAQNEIGEEFGYNTNENPKVGVDLDQLVTTIGHRATE